ncbi:MAG TPA: YDG domain-containing protein, partial [Cellvibrio sp.]|nr:YDG domain-containing protein [Cellvibrio sp.]
MYQHGGLNRVYRLVWNDLTGAFIPIAENSLKTGGGQRRGGIIGSASALVISVAAGLSPFAWADPNSAAGAAPHNPLLGAVSVAPSELPTQGQVVVGQATISQSDHHQIIHQTTDKAAINWQTFNIGADSKVTFIQPDANAVALNRVVTHEASHIYGALEANGQVFLINPNGVLFGKGAQVNVGGIIASTRDVSNENFIAGNYKFSGDGAGQVVNDAKITAAEQGYVVLIGAQVINRGEIHTQRGDVRLAAANEVEIQIENGGLLNLTTTQGTLDGLAANGGLIKADGGRIFLTADALDQLAKASVNNTGIIEAQTIVNQNGKIVLLGDDQVGSTQVAGTLDASAPNGGSGGFIETSAAHVTIDDSARITTQGDVAGEWLIDPVDFTIAASGGDITGSALTTALGSTNVTILSTSGGMGTDGDVNVNDTVAWSSNVLTLNAQADINFNSSMTATGTGSLVLEYGQATTDGAGAGYYLADGVKINLPNGANFSTKQGSTGTTDVYTVINSVGLEGSDNDGTLQGIKGDLDGLYVLGGDVDANATANWNVISGVPWGFDAIGSGFQDPQTLEWQNFTGKFDGLGHTIDGLFINRDVRNNQGLFGVVHGVTIQNVTLTDVNITGNENIGALVGNAAKDAGPSTFRNIHVTGTINSGNRTGGLIGRLEEGIIDRATSSAVISAGFFVGGIAGDLYKVTLTNATASGQVSGAGPVGGAVGKFSEGTATNVTTSGTVSASGSLAGGAIGSGNGTFENIHSTANVTGSAYTGGLFGEATGDSLTNASATGTVNGLFTVGGLIGLANINVTNATASGAVTATSNEAGGLIGQSSGDLNNVEASGTVSGTDSIGGLVGENYGDITDGQASGNVIGSGDSVGGLVGLTEETIITNSHAYGTVTGANKVGGLAGANKMGQVINSTANGLTSGTGDQVGGLVGYNKMGLVDNSTYTAATVMGNNMVGGLVGNNENGTVQNTNVGAAVTGQNEAGGLVGGGSGTITNAFATGAVIGVDRTGGLAGRFDGTVSNAYATGLVTGSGNRVGGLIGSAGGTITTTYATGNVTGVDQVGGLIGYNSAAVTTGEASGIVNGVVSVGGLVGQNQGTLTTIEATGAVTGTENVGGLAGLNGSQINGGDATGVINGSSYVGGAVGKNFATIDDITATGAVTGTVNFAGGAVGFTDADTVVSNTTASGNVTGAMNVGGVIGENRGSALTVSASGTVTASSDNAGGLIGWSTGILDGGTYTGASITSTAGTVGGATGGNIGQVTNVTVTALVSGTFDVGGLIGFNNGQLSASTAAGTVTGSGNSIGGAIGYMETGTVSGVTTTANVSGVDAVGGFIGNSGGTFTDCHATGTVNGNWAVGGFVGENYAAISTSTATGAVTGADESIGGFAGHHYEGSIKDSQASGQVTGGSYTGGFVGYLDGAEILGSTANGNVTGATRMGGFAGYSDGVIVLSTANGDTTGTERVGGFVGRATSDSEIIDSVANGDVFGTVDEIGGFAGTNAGYLAGAQALGAVNAAGAEGVGGLVGTHEGWIEGGSASGAVTGGTDVGGLVGRVMSNDGDEPTSIVEATATGTVTGVTNVGGYIGFNDGVEITGGTSTAAVTGTDRVGGFVGLNTGALYDSSSTSTVNGVNMVGGYAGENRGLLQYVWAEEGNVTATGDMTGGLVGLLDSAGVIEFASAYGTVNGTTNTGGFVGYVMAGGTINYADAENNEVIGTTQVGGFFGYNAGALANIDTETPVTGQEDVGGLGGHNAATGTLNAVYSEGNVTVTGTAPTISAGGLVGENLGVISIAYAWGNVAGSASGSDVGGLVGTQSGNVNDAYATGAVSGAANVGSVFGHMNAGSVANVYGRGAVTQTGSAVGGLVGLMAGGTITYGYWNTDSTGSTMAYGSMTGGTLEQAGGLNADQALQGASYIGFDFTPETGVWKNYDFDTTPLLTHWMEALTITVNDAPITHVYNGQGHTDAVSDLTYSDEWAIGSDDLIGSAHYNTGKNVGTYTDLYGLYSHQQGYNITFVNNGYLEVTPKAIDVTATGIDRVYDGSMDVGVTLGSTGLIQGDDVTFSGFGSMVDRHVGAGKSVSVTDIAADGLDVGNYTFNNTAEATVNITKRNLAVSGVGVNRIYNGSTVVDVILTPVDLLKGDEVSLTGIGNMADKNAGQDKAVTITDISGTGEDAGNYAYIAESATVDIDKLGITVDAEGINRAYDGTTLVAVNLTSTGVLDGDAVTFSGTGNTDDKNVGVDKAVSVTGISGVGVDADNYSYNTSAITDVDISKKSIVVDAQGVNRVYDGTTPVAVNLSSGGVVTGDELMFTGTGAMADPNAGDDKAVAVSGITGTGTDLANYEFNTTTQTTVDIAKREIVVTATGVD